MAEPHNPERTLDQRIEQVHAEVGEHFVEMRSFITFNVTKLRQETRAGFAASDERLDAVQREMAAGFARTETRFERLEARFERLEARSERLEVKLDRALSGRVRRARRPKRGR